MQATRRLVYPLLLSPIFWLIVGAAVAVVPVLFPVWDRDWVEQPSVMIGSTQMPPGWLNHAGVGARKCSDEHRAILFAGPQPPQVWSTIMTLKDGLQWNSFVVSFVPEQVRQQPQYLRAITEAVVVSLPFAIVALVLKLRGPTALSSDQSDRRAFEVTDASVRN